MRIPTPDQIIESLSEQHIAATADSLAAAWAQVFGQ